MPLSDLYVFLELIQQKALQFGVEGERLSKCLRSEPLQGQIANCCLPAHSHLFDSKALAFFFFNIFIGVKLLYNSVLVSAL